MRNNQRSDRNDLTTGAVWKKLLVFFLPIAAGTIIQQLYNAADGLIVGRYVGTEALAAVGGSSAQIINVLVGFFVAMTAGASVIIGQIYGAGRKQDLDRAIGNGTTVFQSSLVLYYIANEGLSILENAALMGVKFPEKLKKALEALREKEEEPPDGEDE